MCTVTTIDGDLTPVERQRSGGSSEIGSSSDGDLQHAQSFVSKEEDGGQREQNVGSTEAGDVMKPTCVASSKVADVSTCNAEDAAQDNEPRTNGYVNAILQVPSRTVKRGVTAHVQGYVPASLPLAASKLWQRRQQRAAST